MNPQTLIERLNSIKKVDVNGRLSFDGFEFNELFITLYSFLTFPSSISENIGRDLISNSLFKIAKDKQLTSENLLTEINKEIRAFLSVPLERYVLFTSISLPYVIKIPTIKTNTSLIKFDQTVPREYVEERAKLGTRIQHLLNAEIPMSYHPVRIFVNTRSTFDAVNAGLDELDFTRAIWNWFYNRKSNMRHSSGRLQPVNKILLGPVHTIHKPSGNLAEDNFWYEPNYLGEPIFPNRDINANDFMKFYKSVKRHLLNHAYSADLKQAFILYTRALDMSNWNESFLRLWSVLEFLTSSSNEDSNNSKSIARAAYIYQNRDYQFQILKHLKNYRNRSVHFSENTLGIETLLYQLKNVVENLLSFHLRNTFHFENINETCAFLDMPSDLDALKKRLILTKHSLKLRLS